ncbi:MAG: methyltransferase domain-containing protein [Anaerolineae bacterium]|nr:methyltransferase domain-containing protein [Anaerolineae bacterium]
MTDRKNIVEAFSELAPQYEQVVDQELSTFWGWSYEEFIQGLLSNIEIGEGERVLDIATGTGVIPLALHRRSPDTRQLVGLDITPAVLAVAQKKLRALDGKPPIDLVCASAHSMPYKGHVFSVVLCALASHHMDVEMLLTEIARVIKPGGRLTIADVAAAPVWRFPPVRWFLRAAAFVYFVYKEGWTRALIESSAVENVLTSSEWEARIAEHDFVGIQIAKLKSGRFWTPSPLIIRAGIPESKGPE